MINTPPSSTSNGNGATPIAKNNDEDDTNFTSIISSHIAALSPSLRDLSLKIHDNPEVRYKELIAHEALTKFMSEQGEGQSRKWKVTPSAYGIATAFVAVWDSGRTGAVVGFNAEYGGSLLSLVCDGM